MKFMLFTFLCLLSLGLLAQKPLTDSVIINNQKIYFPADTGQWNANRDSVVKEIQEWYMALDSLDVVQDSLLSNGAISTLKYGNMPWVQPPENHIQMPNKKPKAAKVSIIPNARKGEVVPVEKK